ncbi:DNA mismatch repair protein MutS [Paenibacillus antri]|uniref:DNA mismatch repair protein MutS n=1 Tax=Paenibacillus antri TaxID=2582848 RepID=A0A5R9GDN9_9BACL|nr:DNA mismatch repair protein MutS [Paenibacillus antri]TLS53219.1 DNA mismatch repair protein MutS [Paenibacillus antri]
MAKVTPMMEQYLSVKAQAQDAFLFFRLGDFYEMFFEDAVLAARELEITLTSRGAGAEEDRIPMCGVPYHSAENYIARLIEKGYKVAICEQVEDPAEAKGVVRREIVRVVTPGTVMDGKTLSERANNYLAAVVERSGRWAIAACDLTTGELYAVATESAADAADELAVYAVTEVVCPPYVSDRLKETLEGRLKHVVYTERQLIAGDDGAWLTERFPALRLDGLDGTHRSAAALLLQYLTETQKRSLGHLHEVRVYEPSVYMTLDPFTRKNLELTETVRDRARKGSLLEMLDKTATSMGARLLRRWLDKPLMSAGAIRLRLDAVEALQKNLLLREDMRELLKRVYDLERLSGRIAYGSANARDLNALAATLAVVPELMELSRGAGSELLGTISGDPDDGADIRDWIEAAVHPEPPASTREGGLIRDGYDAHLDKLREASKSGKRWIAELEQAEREATGIRSLKIGYNKVFGYYIEVTRANLGMVPEGRYERKQTLAAAERYVTPELKEKEALILEAEEKMVDLEYGIFQQLREKIAAEIPRLQRLAERLASLDAIQSLASVAAANRYVRPDVHEGFDLDIESGRHPVVESVLTSGTFIANDTRLTMDETRALLITGPNMAGKSTYMRQVALIMIMAQIGSFVPAKRARVPIVDRVFTRIGAADDLAGGQSTFMVEMQDIQTMIAKATEKSLVVIDELGRGTSTGEGMAIAQAVIEHLHENVGCKTLVSTHYHELAHLEGSLRYLSNACMAVKESGGQVTFLRKLVSGAADTSYGIYCAQLAGLPDSVIDRAYALLHEFEANAEARAAAPAVVGAAAGGGKPQRRGGAPDAAIHQLDMFADWNAAPPAPKRDPRADELVELVKRADVLNMTPIEAMNFLFELKKKTLS